MIKQIRIPKKSGKGFRVVYQLSDDLADKQRRVLSTLNNLQYGIKDCVSAHVGCKVLLSLDIKDAFGSVRRSHFKNLPKEFEISFDSNGRLRQGTPASSFLFETYVNRIDETMQAIAEHYDATYTRYVDDINFSFKKDIDMKDIAKIKSYSAKVLDEIFFKLNHSKTRLSRQGMRTFKVLGVSLDNGHTGVRPLKKQFILMCKHKDEKRAKGMLSYIKQFLDEETYLRMIKRYELSFS